MQIPSNTQAQCRQCAESAERRDGLGQIASPKPRKTTQLVPGSTCILASSTNFDFLKQHSRTPSRKETLCNFSGRRFVLERTDERSSTESSLSVCFSSFFPSVWQCLHWNQRVSTELWPRGYRLSNRNVSNLSPRAGLKFRIKIVFVSLYAFYTLIHKISISKYRIHSFVHSFFIRAAVPKQYAAASERNAHRKAPKGEMDKDLFTELI